MKPKREGPFLITEVLGPITYRLQLPASWRIHNVFHATLLKPYKENEIYGPNFPEPPSELENNEEVYEVDSILNHRKRGRGYQYYVKWRDTQFLKHRGNLNKPFPMTETCCHFINDDINSEPSKR